MSNIADAWGSDAVALALRDTLAVEFVALNPGASFRGLHDSLVNLGAPEMLVCLHEEHAVAIAHGYAKVAERPMAAILHSNVGLMHASMAVYNAWCDRAPIVIVGATGPLDAARRRPWIDWIHTSADQAALVRRFTKWDDQPASLPAAIDALIRADAIARSEPCGPTYVCLDSALQESRIDAVPESPDMRRHRVPHRSVPDAPLITRIASVLNDAKRPVMVVGRVSRDINAWDERIRLAERIGAAVVTDLKSAAGFPTTHIGAPGYFLDEAAKEAIREADVLLSLDTIDLAGIFLQSFGKPNPTALVVSISLDRYALHGWTMDAGGIAPIDIEVAAHPDAVVPLLLDALSVQTFALPSPRRHPASPAPFSAAVSGPIRIADMGPVLRAELGDRPFCITRVPLGWSGHLIPFEDPLSYLGYDGGAGVRSGPGMAVGSALAMRDSGRIPVAILGDGDFLMGCTALWTAVAHKIPLLMIIANNRAYYNDVIHQERLARERGRPLENKWIGQRIDDPPVDLLGMARAQGATTFGPVRDASDLGDVFSKAIRMTRDGQTCVIDVAVEAEYGAAMTTALSRDAAASGTRRR